MKERWVEVSGNAGKKQEDRFETWLSGKGISFANPEAEEAYRERVTLMKDAIQLKKPPKRVAVCPSAGHFPIEYGGISWKEAMYDYDKLAEAWKKYFNDFLPDAFNGPNSVVSGKMLGILDFKLYRWAGQNLRDDQEYQFVEGEYMRADEYQDFIDDPTGYFLNVYFPRIFGALKPLEKLPIFPPVHELPVMPPAIMRFGMEDVASAFLKLLEAGKEVNSWFSRVAEANSSILSQGYPTFSGGFTKAPFDVLGDSLRGTKGVLMDMFRCPDEVIEACERITPIMIKNAVASCNATGHIMPFIPLHKGADGFMSDEQFRTFYWPTLRKLIIGLVDAGLVPQLFAEGGYNSRLEAITDIPKGSVLWWFDLTDMERAKENVGKVSCIAGNVPLDLLCTGTPDDVKGYCKNLIDVAGRDGGFILSSGAGMQGSKPENVKAMIDFSKSYGVYE